MGDRILCVCVCVGGGGGGGGTLHFRPFLAKTNASILRKSPNTLFLGFFGPLFPIFQKMRIFPTNRALSLLKCKSKKTACKYYL